MRIYDFTVERINGSSQNLSDYEGKVVLIVNTASRCGFTPQYKGLEALYDKYNAQGFEVLGFPCNQFGEQEPGTNQEIQQFCESTYGVRFPMFAKIDVNGPNAHPLYEYLKKEVKGVLGTEPIKWNFTKFLVDRNGKVIKRYAPQTEPSDIERDVQRVLAQTNS